MVDLVALSRSIANHSRHPIERPPHSGDLWLATSALQKAVRRGEIAAATRAGAVLATRQPDRLWRRLVVIAMEDVGIADLDLVESVLAVSGRRAWRRHNGGEEKVAAYFVSRLGSAPKCRDGCDILVVADLSPALREQRAEFATISSNELADIVVDRATTLPERVLAAWYLAGTRNFPGEQLVDRGGSFRLLCEVYEQLGIPPDILDIARMGATRTREAHPVSLPLIYEHATRTREHAIQREAPRSLGVIGGWPSEALDMHCRPGTRALSLFRDRVRSITDPVRQYVPPRLVATLIGTLVFRVEGAAVDRRFVYPGSGAILDMATMAHCTWSGLPQELAQPLLQRTLESLPELHRCRQAVMGAF